ncbi:hypothetical protein SAMD00024442_4_12 [Candidatus Symbiothrix dinenymphae]|nr:hypothetical protein SAMD00024442_4_12 [Candidatus Symbiothrix dinenymphae]
MKNMKCVRVFSVAVLVAGVFSCDRDELFEREQYKTVIAMLSEDGYNVFAEEHELGTAATETEGCVVASCGGSLATGAAISINMTEDESLLDRYNVGNYDVDEGKYAQYLSADRYVIDNPANITIPAGERTGRMKIKIRATGLCPDSTYLIPLRVNTYSAYEFNPEKSDVLYRVLLKNFYATQTPTSLFTLYNFRGVRNGANIMGNKQVFPVSGTQARIMAGNIDYEAKRDIIKNGSILLDVGNDNKVTITPWSKITVRQKNAVDDGPGGTYYDPAPAATTNWDDNYPNIFKVENDGFGKMYKTFQLQYEYEYQGTTYHMKEELRLEYD